MRIIAHRGASKYAPENTLAAFEKAYQLGAKYLECDIALTKDNVPIIIHDDTLERTTNGSGLVTASNWADISNLDAGLWYSSEFQGLKIPSLAELLRWHAQHDIVINYEIKQVDAEKVPFTVSTILHEFQKIKPYSKFIFSSFQFAILHELRKASANFTIHSLVEKCSDATVEEAKKLNCIQYNLDLGSCSPYWIDKIHQVKMDVGVYTVNHAPIFKMLRDWGVDAVFTDDLPMAFESLTPLNLQN
jgi:glycerophosphoryl diester phosphodiesterase